MQVGVWRENLDTVGKVGVRDCRLWTCNWA